MSRNSGEQGRRRAHVIKGVAATEHYDRLMLNRDRTRLVKALRDAANRIEAEAKKERATLTVIRHDAGFSVTDHAVVRFLERVMQIDVPSIRAKIAEVIPEAKRRPSGSPGEHHICVRDGFQFLLTSGSVISVLSPDMDGRPWLERDELDALETLGAA